MTNEKATDPPRSDPAGGADGDTGGSVCAGSGDRIGLGVDPELDFLDSVMVSPETRAMLQVWRALCRRRLLGISEVLYSPSAGNC